MKAAKISLIIILLGIICGLQGCSKYEDGPLISLKTKQNRVLGYWESVKLFIDNDEQNGNGAIFYEFKDDGSYHRVFEFGEWEFDKKKEKLIMTSDLSSDSYEMSILRLTDKELWIKRNISSKTYEYHFEKID